MAKHYGVDPLELVSSGALLLAVAPPHAAALLAGLAAAGIAAADIGRVEADPAARTIAEPGRAARPLRRPEQDALWSCLEHKQ